ncbi:MAG: GldM family protein, partial [Bacteroidia bacterium]
EYNANRAPAIISLDKMNVVFTNLDNPISISIPGFYPEQINASLSPVNVGSLQKVGPGRYNAKINKRDRNGCNINVSVKLPDGSLKSMGRVNYRTMKVPKPTPSLNGNSGNKISVGALRSVKALSVVLENFVFEGIRYQVESFDYRYYKASGELVEGSSDSRILPDELRLAIKDATTGDFVVFYNIKASAQQIGEIDIPGAMAFEIE